jgi:hypothetical protein
MDVFNSMKYNIRLWKSFYDFWAIRVKVQHLTDDIKSLFDLKVLLNINESSTYDVSTERRSTDFSFLLLNILQTRTSRINEKQSQLLLQSTDGILRLNTIKDLISDDSNNILQHLYKKDIISIENNDELLLQVFLYVYVFMYGDIHVVIYKYINRSMNNILQYLYKRYYIY